MTDTESQRAAIKRALNDGKKLTHLGALRLFGCARLAARIHELRKEGMDIKKEMVDLGGNRFAEYSLSFRHDFAEKS